MIANEIQSDEKIKLIIEKIDNQHRKIINKIIQLNEDYQRNVEPEQLQLELIEIFVFLYTHFRTEEGYMKSFDYSEYHSHSEQHQLFTSSLISQLKGFEENPKTTVLKTLDLLNSWFIDNHMWLADRRFGVFLFEKSDSLK